MRGGNYVVIVNTHMPKRVRAPALIFKKNPRSAIHQTGKTPGLGSGPGKAVVRQTHGDDLANPIGKRNFVTYDRGKRQPTYEKDQHELKRSHLLAGTPPYDADNQDQEKIPKERPQNCRHGNNP